MEMLDLWPAGAMPHARNDGTDDKPTLTLFVPDRPTRSAVVVLPGGGYGGHAPYEGDPVSKWLAGLGIAGATCIYRVGTRGYRHPAPLADARRAIRVLRERGYQRVGILGFSAGGHLASTAATLPGPPEERPDAAILIYPVITLEGPAAHIGSRDNLLGSGAPMSLVRQLSTQNAVDRATPATFLVHTVDDKAVPVDNSLMFAQACARHGVPFAMQVYQQGPHGIGMGKPEFPETLGWPAACAAWLKVRGF